MFRFDNSQSLPSFDKQDLNAIISISEYPTNGRLWFIYFLCDPRNGIVRYVGYTVNPKDRIRGHIHDSMRRPWTKNSRWIKKLMSDGVRPQLTIIDIGSGPRWREAERFYIREARKFGFDLNNATEGGDGTLGLKLSPELRAAISLRNTGRKCSVESRARMSIAQRGLKKPPTTQEMNDRMSADHPFKNKSHCKFGHEYDEKNTYFTTRVKNGRLKRACRKCRAARQRAYILRKASA